MGIACQIARGLAAAHRRQIVHRDIGRVPFGGEYEQAVIYAILNQPARALEGEVPAELAGVIDKALAKAAAARYQTAEGLEEALAGIPLGEGGEVARRKPARVRRRLPVSWKWLAGGLAVLVALGLVAVAIWYWREHLWDFKLSSVLYGRSFCAAKLGRYDEAFANIKEALRLKPPIRWAFSATIPRR